MIEYICPNCGKKFLKFVPTSQWAYKAFNLPLCSWHCLNEIKTKYKSLAQFNTEYKGENLASYSKVFVYKRGSADYIPVVLQKTENDYEIIKLEPYNTYKEALSVAQDYADFNDLKLPKRDKKMLTLLKPQTIKSVSFLGLSGTDYIKVCYNILNKDKIIQRRFIILNDKTMAEKFAEDFAEEFPNAFIRG